ncbi:MAG: hypothetical protein QOH26_776 [Actinomycetota bacterium]|nr:hypothetical protein [Actinomycetota bacterium]
MKRVLVGGLAVLILGGVATLAAVQLSTLGDEKAVAERRAHLLALRVRGLEDTIEDLEDETLRRFKATREARTRSAALNRALRRARERLSARTCFTPPGRPPVRWYRRGPLRGDIDGDGSTDSVVLVARPGPRPEGCRYILRAETAAATFFGGVGDERKVSKFDIDLGFLVELNGDPGYEILVRSGHPAAGELFTAFTLEAGRLTEVRNSDGDPFSVGNFWTAGVGGNVDCLQDGNLVSSGYSYDPKRNGYYGVTRTFFDVAGSFATEIGSEHLRVPAPHGLGRFPELSGRDDSVVPSCPRP